MAIPEQGPVPAMFNAAFAAVSKCDEDFPHVKVRNARGTNRARIGGRAKYADVHG
jgi:hypothetical protein